MHLHSCLEKMHGSTACYGLLIQNQHYQKIGVLLIDPPKLLSHLKLCTPIPQTFAGVLLHSFYSKKVFAVNCYPTRLLFKMGFPPAVHSISYTPSPVRPSPFLFRLGSLPRAFPKQQLVFLAPGFSVTLNPQEDSQCSPCFLLEKMPGAPQCLAFFLKVFHVAL